MPPRGYKKPTCIAKPTPSSRRLDMVWTGYAWHYAKLMKHNPRHLPTIPVKVGFHPAHHSQPFPSAYWYVCSRELLWSIFERFGLIQERA